MTTDDVVGGPRVTVMAAVAANGVIGRDGSMPWHLPDDLRRFRTTTMGSVLVMGRRTYESIGRPLIGRTTVVVTRRRPYPSSGAVPPGLIVAATLDEALRCACHVAASGTKEVFVQGGSRVYAEALPMADRLLITWVDGEPEGDTVFPEVDWSQWSEQGREPFSGGCWATYARRSGPVPGAAEKPPKKISPSL